MAVYMFGATVVVDMEDRSTPQEMLAYSLERANHFERRGDLLVGIVGRDGSWTTQKSRDLAKAFRVMAEKYASLVRAGAAANTDAPVPAAPEGFDPSAKLAALKDAVLQKDTEGE